MARVATRNSSQSRNQLLAAMSAADFASLQPHLKPVPMALLKDMERPNQRIETVYFMETGIASVVAVQPDETRVEVGLIGREGMSGMAVVLGGNQSPHATYIQVAGEGQRITANRIAQGDECEPDAPQPATQIRPSLHGADGSHRHRECSGPY